MSPPRHCSRSPPEVKRECSEASSFWSALMLLAPWSEVAWPCRVFIWYPVLLSVPAKASEPDTDENPPPLRDRGLRGVLREEQSRVCPLL